MTGYTGWNQQLFVTLTGTSNPYLAPHLPLRGLLRIHEMRTDGHAQGTKVTFLQLDEAGNPVGTEVSADEASFQYDPRPDGAELNAREGTDIARPRRDTDTKTRGTDGPFDAWEHDHTELVHVLWAATHQGLNLADDFDEIASMIMRSRWRAATLAHGTAGENEGERP